MALLKAADDHLSIETLAVAPSRQGCGVGSRLIAFAEEQTKLNGVTKLRLYTNERMDENLVFYPRQGFTESHRGRSDGF
ncbi:MAG TPA: GNAT family N-acetyltransferase [Acidimicrobiales bacterium]